MSVGESDGVGVGVLRRERRPRPTGWRYGLERKREFRLGAVGEADREWSRSIRVPMLVRPAEADLLRRCARAWGVPTATAAWALIHERLMRAASRQVRFPAEVVGPLRLAGELAAAAGLIGVPRASARPLAPGLAAALGALEASLEGALEASGASGAGGTVALELRRDVAEAVLRILEAQRRVDDALEARPTARGPRAARRTGGEPA